MGSLFSIDTSPHRLDASRGEQLPVLIEERLRELLGEPLSDVDRASVQLVPLRACLPGEIVAVEDSHGVLRYGQVKHDEEEDLSSSGEAKVQVTKSCIRWYAVSEIFYFQSLGARKDGQVVDVAWTGRRPSQSTKHEELLAEEGGSSTVGVIAEVNALLARLNVSLSTSYEELMAEMLRLQHRATLAEEDRRAALKQVEQALRDKRDAEMALVCVVCLVNSVDKVLIPCGHSYCSTCVKRLHRHSCPVCRREITDSAAFRIS
ncbi:hypothetical protein PR003_g27165 [Phytophthora rubi]|uniref:RING-type domain-containing protein n=1 Tax=Phytophthora rubi TaxID=129364 RepID=A0A6A3HW85_9STRA|nr:hypothetical protein PR002_g26117 [Phytophthora rubi]KAE8974371.1 hypothetical protein PR001_g26015 [Phytophthora rubi]KAE9283286.1 hypothetical protein PR003_g27165 [Phytophthora rubi]